MAEQPDDILIAVMGCTGTGKSSFIKLLSGNTSIRIGDSLESETSEVQVVPFLDPGSGRKVIIVDTPGFDDSREGVSDTQVLKKISEFLLHAYDHERKLNGLIYIQRISDTRFSGQSRRNLTMFRNLCGTKAYENVVVLTTFWDKVSSEQGNQREEQLKAKFFKDLVEGHARFMRHNLTLESARDVLRHISTLDATNVQIQEEIRVEGKKLEDTAAGSVHREEVERIIAEHKVEMAGLKDELETMRNANSTLRQELEEERAILEQKLARLEAERVELKKGLDDAKETQERMAADAEQERVKHEQWRQDQEHEWNSRFQGQKQEHDEKMRQQRDEFERKWQEQAAKEDARRREHEDQMRRQRETYERQQREAAARDEARRREHEEAMRRQREDSEKQRQKEDARQREHAEQMHRQREQFEMQRQATAEREEARRREHEQAMCGQREEFERQRQEAAARDEARGREHEQAMRQLHDSSSGGGGFFDFLAPILPFAALLL
ncbi:hypothetical protein APHAL10511_001418 [Amanita phalloides]|nr:hypothetical protein APHAL10511_001418 [Amanita phalloides]